MIKLDINKGDTILTGKFRNKKTVVKTIGTDEHGSPTVNGKTILNCRIQKLMKKETIKENVKQDGTRIPFTPEESKKLTDLGLSEGPAGFYTIDTLYIWKNESGGYNCIETSSEKKPTKYNTLDEVISDRKLNLMESKRITKMNIQEIKIKVLKEQLEKASGKKVILEAAGAFAGLPKQFINQLKDTSRMGGENSTLSPAAVGKGSIKKVVSELRNNPGLIALIGKDSASGEWLFMIVKDTNSWKKIPGFRLIISDKGIETSGTPIVDNNTKWDNYPSGYVDKVSKYSDGQYVKRDFKGYSRNSGRRNYNTTSELPLGEIVDTIEYRFDKVIFSLYSFTSDTNRMAVKDSRKDNRPLEKGKNNTYGISAETLKKYLIKKTGYNAVNLKDLAKQMIDTIDFNDSGLVSSTLKQLEQVIADMKTKISDQGSFQYDINYLVNEFKNRTPESFKKDKYDWPKFLRFVQTGSMYDRSR